MIEPSSEFMERFGGDDDVAAHNLRCEMVARAIRAIGDSIKVTHAGGQCWRFPKVNNGGYGVTSVLHKVMVASRLVLCVADNKPYDYKVEGEFMEASHRTPIICRYMDCLNPEHLYWASKSANCKRREVEEKATKAAGALAGSIIPSMVT